MVRLDLETQRKGKQHATPKGALPVSINHRRKNPRHKRNRNHLGIMSNLDNLHIIGAESHCHRTKESEPNINAKSKHKQKSAHKTNKQIACRTLANKQRIIKVFGNIALKNNRNRSCRHTAEHRISPKGPVTGIILIILQNLIGHTLPT